MANQVYNFVEYRFALFELNKLKDDSEQTKPGVVKNNFAERQPQQ